MRSCGCASRRRKVTGVTRIRRERPGPGQESVWDYPRPPRVERSTRRIKVVLGGVTIVDTEHSLRVLETSHPPVYYLPADALTDCRVTATGRRTLCEYKGTATYHTIAAGGCVAPEAAWSYSPPAAGYEPLLGHVALYPSRMDACYVDDERVRAQAGDFYGGWVTSDIVGPFKGAPGTWGW